MLCNAGWTFASARRQRDAGGAFRGGLVHGAACCGRDHGVAGNPSGRPLAGLAGPVDSGRRSAASPRPQVCGGTSRRVAFGRSRIVSQALVVTATIYAIGWGPALAIGLVLVGQEALVVTGSSSRARGIAGWNLSCLAAGELLIALGWVPSLVPAPEVHGLAVLMAIGIAFSYRSLRTALIEKEDAAALTESHERRFRALVQLFDRSCLRRRLDQRGDVRESVVHGRIGLRAGTVVGLGICGPGPSRRNRGSARRVRAGGRGSRRHRRVLLPGPHGDGRGVGSKDSRRTCSKTRRCKV